MSRVSPLASLRLTTRISSSRVLARALDESKSAPSEALGRSKTVSLMPQRGLEMRDRESRFETRARRRDDLSRRLRGRRNVAARGLEKR